MDWNLVVSWLFSNWELITAIIAFVVYFRLNKRQKAAEVKQAEVGVKRSEADVKQSEAGALSTFQGLYDEFANDFKEKWDEVTKEVSAVKNENRENKVTIEDLQRQTRGLTREVGQLKISLSEVENIACLDLACLKRQPELGKYKHKKEA